MAGFTLERRGLGGIMAGLVLAAAVSAGTAQAGVGFPIGVDPTSGPPGTVITVTATCLPSTPAPDSLRLDFNTTGGSILNTEVVAITPDVEVAATIAVPGDTAPGTYRVLAQCLAGNQATVFAQPVDFTVTDPAATTSTTSTTSTSVAVTTTTLAPASTAVPSAPPEGLPPTGQRESNTALLAAALVTLGAAALLLSRRRTAA